VAARRPRADVEPDPAPICAPPGERNNVIAERSLRALILSAERVAATITDNTELTLARPDVVAKALAALGETITTAADGLAKLAALCGDAAEEGDALQGALEAYERELEDSQGPRGASTAPRTRSSDE
jgi:hypothetical protein